MIRMILILALVVSASSDTLPENTADIVVENSSMTTKDDRARVFLSAGTGEEQFNADFGVFDVHQKITIKCAVQSSPPYSNEPPALLVNLNDSESRTMCRADNGSSLNFDCGQFSFGADGHQKAAFQCQYLNRNVRWQVIYSEPPLNLTLLQFEMKATIKMVTNGNDDVFSCQVASPYAITEQVVSWNASEDLVPGAQADNTFRVAGGVQSNQRIACNVTVRVTAPMFGTVGKNITLTRTLMAETYLIALNNATAQRQQETSFIPLQPSSSFVTGISVGIPLLAVAIAVIGCCIWKSKKNIRNDDIALRVVESIIGPIPYR